MIPAFLTVYGIPVPFIDMEAEFLRICLEANSQAIADSAIHEMEEEGWRPVSADEIFGSQEESPNPFD